MRIHFLLTLLLTGWLHSQAQDAEYSRVKILLSETTGIEQVAQLGLDICHGEYRPGKYLISDFSNLEISWLAQSGLSYEILIDDVVAHYVAQNQSAAHELETRNGDCQLIDPYGNFATPANFQLGSMGGFYTYQEMLDILDDMFNQYPHLISYREPIGELLTHNENPIYWIRISDNPQIDEEEPEVLYTALHHAREPNSLSQLIYFMWYLLENYDSDPSVQYLVDEVELYFVPCVNPDGYQYNELTNPEGGGLWRKNRRLNDDGSYGVDLNRNYGFGWGYDDNGSSPSPMSNVYRGPEGFSEPETQNMREFCNDHEFQVALNYHTYGNLLIYPWGYLDTATVDAAYFSNIANAISRRNDFLIGTATETVGYQVNGVSDDWMYGENTTKPAIFSMTPEVGPDSYGFWPPESEIETLCRSTLFQNLATGFVVLNYGYTTDLSPFFVDGLFGSIDFELTKAGIAPGDLTVNLVGISPEIIATGPAQAFSLDVNEAATGSIGFTLDESVSFSQELLFELSVSNGEMTWRDTLTKTFLGLLNTVWQNPADNLDAWLPEDDWGLTEEAFVSATTSITDSPDRRYFNNENSSLYSTPITLDTGDAAYLSFYALWEIETDYDYVQLLALEEDYTPITALCGFYTNEGVGGFQPEGEPLYDGTQASWVEEQIDLTEFLGQTIILQFVLASDGGVRRDGFYLDDLSLQVFQEGLINKTALTLKPSTGLYLSPNPVQDLLKIELRETLPTPGKALVYNNLGKLVKVIIIEDSEIEIAVDNLPSGLYHVILTDGTTHSAPGRFVKK